ncbi:hypothetical protein G7Y89_g10711 [Cudoniella acicularis]|uniref:Heterokaryon incompatibility domain-containing protein n=1 Tax=Cudoniella acicularis TaxID=354080 RepID=A0A8H4REJ6_9HELO|nr:hypothetical protein G7Y89_g10711 [Cudoniella acicularis]
MVVPNQVPTRNGGQAKDIAALNRTVQGVVKPTITQCCMRQLYTTNDQSVIDSAKLFERKRCGHHDLERPLSTLECLKSCVDPKGAGILWKGICEFEAILSDDQKVTFHIKRSQARESPPDSNDVMCLTAEIDRSANRKARRLLSRNLHTQSKPSLLAMASAGPQAGGTDDKFERLQAEDTVVSLNQLCTACVRFTETSKLLQKFSRREKIKHLEEEVLGLCSAERLKAGYLDGCHLCTLFWRRADGQHLLRNDPKADSRQLEVSLTATARDASGEGDTMNRLPFIAATGSLSIRLINPDKTRPRSDPRSIEAYLETNPSLNQNILGKLEEPISSKSDVKLSQIVDWYYQCTERHMKCTGFSSMVAPSQQLPSRLLDLGDNKLRLECDVQSILDLRYATLSHVWGNDPASYLQLKEATLEAFKTEVPFDAIPIKYKDSIRITRALGIRYLWIDSLCIIQDSPKDWTTEALKMAAVYGCSACNISYTHAPSEEPAKRYLRDPRVNIPCKLTAASARPSRLSAFGVNHLWSKPLPPAAVVVQPVAGAIHGSWSTEAYRRVCSLLSRAWVFQERLLCPRTIYYGHDRLLWECCETFNDEFSGPMPYVPRSKAQIYSAFSGVAQDQTLASLLGHFDGQWKSIVNDYRSCKLTFEKDRAIAFAGIASAIQSQTGMTYLAGIWKETVYLDLLWLRPGRGSLCCQLSPDYDVVDYGLSTIAALRSKETVYHASVLSFEHPKLPAELDALFYDFDGLRIRLSTYKIPAGLRWENDVVQLMPHGQPMLPNKLDFFPDYDPRTAMKCTLDDLSLNVNKELPKNASIILLVFQVYHEGIKGYRFSGLVVVPEESLSGRDGSWKRIGVYTFDVQGPAASIEVVLPFDFESREPDEVWLK